MGVGSISIVAMDHAANLLSHADGELREYLETVRLGNAGTSGRIDKEKP